MKKRKLYLGISGKMGSGKTTLTEGLKKELASFKSERVSMAAPIKEAQDMLYEKFDLTMEGEKDRPLLIALGMWGRDKSPSFWLDQAVKKFETSDADIVICDDVRFPNEADWFAENGLLIRLEGEQRGPNVDEERKNDSSEIALDDYNFENIIDNLQGIESTLMSALYVIAKHVGVNETIMQQVVEEVHKGE